MSNTHPPIPGSVLFDAVHGMDCIVMATNVRMFPGVGAGILRAAKKMDAAIMMEIARSEGNLPVGYTGMGPAEYAANCMEAADQVGNDVWVLHADHITVKKGDDTEIAETKKLIDAQVKAGFTSFAIDASHLYNFEGGNVAEEMALNIKATTTLAHHILERMDGRPFGLEVEVGEIGKEDQYGRVLTTPEEAVVFIKALNDNGVKPHVIAIANGSAHGNTYDAKGNLVEQVSIDIAQTKAVAQALRDAGLKVGIAQHGITGTPRELIKTQFPRGDILKGNVATFYQNMYWDHIKVYDPDLYARAWVWTQDNYGSKNPNKAPNEVFGKNSKFAIKQFFDELNSQGEDFVTAVEAEAYAQTLVFLHAFNSKGTASAVRKELGRA